MRYIDADKLIDTIELAELPVIARSVLTECIIPNQPTADVVEVVRCRYCKHRDTNECPYDTVNYMLADSDFCSSGERADT